MSSSIVFDTLSHGKSKAESKGAKHGFERRVENRLDGAKAAKVMQLLANGK